MAKVLIACEESQVVCIAFRERGHEAYSCDIQDCSGGHPEWHIRGDVRIIMQREHWDLIIAHPPCTYMSKAGARWMYPTAKNIDENRYKMAVEAKEFFMLLLNAPAKFIAVENPVPLKVVALPKHTQSVQPYEYGHGYSKKTLLWLKNLPLLSPTNIQTVYTPYLPSNTGGKKKGQKYHYTGITQKESSKTFTGIAKAMAEQWGDYININL